MSENPFALLGLPARADLSDDDVRAAWRRVAAASHPDRDDGGDPARFGAAAAAYALLRTGFGRGEALADLAGAGAAGGGGRTGGRRGGRAGRHAAARRPGTASRPRTAPRTGWARGAGAFWARAFGARPVVARAAVAVTVIAGVFLVAGWAPSSIGVLAGTLSWLLVSTGRVVPWRRSR